MEHEDRKPEVLVIGARGQLARALQTASRKAGMPAVTTAGRPQLDLTDPETIEDTLRTLRPAIIINTAAWTDVDGAERKPRAAFAVNRDGAARLARVCARLDLPLMHISTDFVFDGMKGAPCTEADAPAPVNAYGESKLLGEHAVRTTAPRSMVVRVSWLHGPTGENILTRLLRLTSGPPPGRIRVATDRIASPTWTPGLAETLLRIAATLPDRPEGDPAWDIWHLADAGGCSLYELACTAFSASGMPEVEPALMRDFPSAARRPHDTRLDCRKIQRHFGLAVRKWTAPFDMTESPPFTE